MARFGELLEQYPILENLVLTGLRGVGKTVLLDSFRPRAHQAEWWWVGTDLSEATSLTEHNLAIRLLADLSAVTSSILYGTSTKQSVGYTSQPEQLQHRLSYTALAQIFDRTPGLVSDKLKNVLTTVWQFFPRDQRKGIVFAYDEAQNLADHASENEYPLSLMLDVFQSIQKMDIPFMLVLTGLPTLFPKLVESRTFSERMFHIMFLDRLSEDDSKDAIVKPIEGENCLITFTGGSVDEICALSGGYPYFIQFICKEVYDMWIQQIGADEPPSVPVDTLMSKLDRDFFAGRWARATDRQRELLCVAALLDNASAEFTVQEIVDKAKTIDEIKSFSGSHANQMLSTLGNAGLVYKNRHGKYSFAVPMLEQFIRRQMGH